MEKTDKLTKAISVILFLALAAYLFGWLWNSTHSSVVTAPVTATSLSDSIQASGIAVRDEVLLSSTKQFLSVQADDGKAVAAGSALALAMDSEQSLEKMNHISELQLEIDSLQSVLAGSNTASDVTSREADIQKSILGITACTARGELAMLDSAAIDLSALVFNQEASTDAQSRLAALKEELAQCKTDKTRGAVTLTAPSSGLFSRNPDGYESLSNESLANLTVSKLNAIQAQQQEISDGVYGKLIVSQKWYFAAVIDADHATRLAVGKSAYLEFSRYYSEKIPAVVESISAAEGGQCAVVFSTERALADTLTMRKATAEIVFSETEGLRVPIKAMHVDDKGTFVYCITAQRVEKKYVEVVSTQDDFYLISIANNANALREGNTVIVSGKDIFEGKVIQQ